MALTYLRWSSATAIRLVFDIFCLSLSQGGRRKVIANGKTRAKFRGRTRINNLIFGHCDRRMSECEGDTVFASEEDRKKIATRKKRYICQLANYVTSWVMYRAFSSTARRQKHTCGVPCPQSPKKECDSCQQSVTKYSFF